MTAWLPRFDELDVVSDLHLGGRRDERGDFQIFNRGPRLAAFIAHVQRARDGGGDVALVLNGDVFDSLAEDVVPGYVALDAATSLALMERLYGDPTFAPVWQALADFVRTARRHLIVVIGNHDVELALPTVQHSLREHLAGEDRDARARLVFAAHGEGFACWVGGARVFCTHGNQTDPWNFVDHEALAQLAAAFNAGRAVPAARWQPNRGTRLVVDLMNDVKRRFPFVDLLKPERAALLGVLVALGREVLSDCDLAPFVPIAHDAAASRRAVADLLGDAAAPADAPAPLDMDSLRNLLGPKLRAALHVQPEENVLLLRAAQAVAAGRTPHSAAPAGEGAETLGPLRRAGALLWGALGGTTKEEGLRRALADWLAADRSYDVLAADDPADHALCLRAGEDIDFLIAGHTHLARARRRERGFYFNSGTWARLLQLTPQALEQPEIFAKRVWPALSAGRLSALDDATLPGPNGDLPLLLDRTTAVRVRRDGDATLGELLHVSGADAPHEALSVVPMNGACFRRS